MRTTRFVHIVLVVVAGISLGFAQQSDYEVKEHFKAAYDALKVDIDSARTPEQMAQIPNRIRGLESEYGENRMLISGAFYPKTFEEMIGDLRTQYTLAQSKATTIQAQETRIVELEGLLATLNTELEGLTAEREHLLSQLRSTQNSLAQQRDLVKRDRKSVV